MQTATSGAQPAGKGIEYAQQKAVKQMNDFQFIVYTFKKSFVALAFLRLLSEKWGGTKIDDVIAAVVALVIGFLLRHKTTRRVLPSKVVELWEPLRKIRKSRVLKFKTSILIDLLSHLAYFYPMYFKLAFGKSGWTPISVFLVQYLYSSFTLAVVDLTQVWTGAANFIPTATLGWLDENKFINKKDIWRALRDPAVAKQITRQFFKRVKEFYAEEKERRKLGLSEEDAVNRFAQGVALSATQVPSSGGQGVAANLKDKATAAYEQVAAKMH